MGVAREGTVTKLYEFHNVPPFCQFYKKVGLQLSEHCDVIETQTIRIAPPNFFSKLGPWWQLYLVDDYYQLVIFSMVTGGPASGIANPKLSGSKV